MKSFRVIGLMSGTSLDGLDVADVTFELLDTEEWKFKLNHASIFSYDKVLLSKLKSAVETPSYELIKLSIDLGRFYADKVNDFLLEFNINKSEIDFIASHGQTIFHQPKIGYTLQIGNGPELAVHTNLPTVVDFRSKDVALGGNGAPLIPVADHLLFNSYADTFLNLGGFSNFSFMKSGQVFSYDICPVNIVVNELMGELGKEYDEHGDFGKGGSVHKGLLDSLNALSFYNEEGPKSLGWEWVVDQIHPLLKIELSLKDKIRTLYEHIGIQIGDAINSSNSKSTLVTGGGTKNKFLIERIQYYTQGKIIVPDENIIDFKEAIGFAFLGLLKWQGKINVWSSVTGSNRDSSSGIVIRP
ncbi:anhydro-N-acetylmuramic acid kinase [Brumimicrobium mesophilum]|uniref:anhydro-N-acetylmuramic acid kinase n=1 Tax=Brumimicrobium mesophilum TaxID=392717 RepID=UPI000D143700|nr:anhydro-N-acetylmuramic acid kinase [Brumimicrobium mesophilum]